MRLYAQCVNVVYVIIGSIVYLAKLIRCLPMHPPKHQLDNELQDTFWNNQQRKPIHKQEWQYTILGIQDTRQLP